MRMITQVMYNTIKTFFSASENGYLTVHIEIHLVYMSIATVDVEFRLIKLVVFIEGK